MDHAISRTESIFWITAGTFLVLFAVTLGMHTVDKRLMAGESVWTKPLQFDAALALHFATLALATRALSATYRESTLLLGVAIAATFSAGFEIVYMSVQAARQQASHFNLSTPFHAAMYSLMAAGAFVITAAAGAVGVATFFDENSHLSLVSRSALALGLIGGTLLTLIVAFRMGAALNHHVGVESTNSPRVPLFGWSRTVGDLRVPHFLATHMMQAMPAAGLAIERVGSGTLALAAVWLLAVVWAALTLFAFNRALAGQPLI